MAALLTFCTMLCESCSDRCVAAAAFKWEKDQGAVWAILHYHLPEPWDPFEDRYHLVLFDDLGQLCSWLPADGYVEGPGAFLRQLCRSLQAQGGKCTVYKPREVLPEKRLGCYDTIDKLRPFFYLPGDTFASETGANDEGLRDHLQGFLAKWPFRQVAIYAFAEGDPPSSGEDVDTSTELDEDDSAVPPLDPQPSVEWVDAADFCLLGLNVAFLPH